MILFSILPDRVPHHSRLSAHRFERLLKRSKRSRPIDEGFKWRSNFDATSKHLVNSDFLTPYHLR